MVQETEDTNVPVPVSSTKFFKVGETDSSCSESNLRLQESQRRPNLRLDNINPLILNFKAMEYAARGPVIKRAIEIESEIAMGIPKSFHEVIKANLGDAQAMGQTPITFIRQVLALVTCPSLIETQLFPEDVKEKAKHILGSLRGRSIGSYTDSRGVALIRNHVANFITQRDSGISAASDDIFLCAGASDGIRACLKLLKSGPDSRKVACLTPIPEYPLYNATLGEYDISQIGYYLDEERDWSINLAHLQTIVHEAKEKGLVVRAIVIINPGNPTGHVLSRRNMEEIIKFAYNENLVIFADEVYQENLYGESEFFSFRRVIMELEHPYSSAELFSFYSTSKGYVCECGVRGGYFETKNIDPDVKSVLEASIAAKLCPTILGQTVVDCAVNPPNKGSSSYELFEKEKLAIQNNLLKKVKLVQETMDSLPGITCSKIQGAMYAFPKLNLPAKAIQASHDKQLVPDVFYALELLEKEGICVVPGSGLGQLPGTFHFRITILPPLDKLQLTMEKFKSFHQDFIQRYS